MWYQAYKQKRLNYAVIRSLKIKQVSISRVAFSNKSVFAAFVHLQFVGFVIFWCMEMRAKVTHKILIKLTPECFQIQLFIES